MKYGKRTLSNSASASPSAYPSTKYITNFSGNKTIDTLRSLPLGILKARKLDKSWILVYKYITFHAYL